MSAGVEDDVEAMRYLRHEAGTRSTTRSALYDRADWRRDSSARYSQPVSRALSRRSILARVRAPHPRLVCAEASRRGFRRDVRGVAHAGPRLAARVRGWPALAKLEYVDRVMREIATTRPAPLQPTDDDLPVEAMHYTVARALRRERGPVPIDDERQFDGDLRAHLRVSATRRAGGRGSDRVHPPAPA